MRAGQHFEFTIMVKTSLSLTAVTLLVCMPLWMSASCAHQAVKAPPLSERASVVFADEQLRERLIIGDPKIERDDADSIRYVKVPVRAGTQLKIFIDYRVTFFDGAGVKLKQSSWQTRTLDAGMEETITFNSTAPQAASFQIELRYAK